MSDPRKPVLHVEVLGQQVWAGTPAAPAAQPEANSEAI